MNGAWGSFWRLWLVMATSFVAAKLVLDLAFFDWVDLRPGALLQLPLLPAVQAVVFWAITRRRRTSGSVTS
jgi:hypothetical protein